MNDTDDVVGSVTRYHAQPIFIAYSLFSANVPCIGVNDKLFGSRHEELTSPGEPGDVGTTTWQNSVLTLAGNANVKPLPSDVLDATNRRDLPVVRSLMLVGLAVALLPQYIT